MAKCIKVYQYLCCGNDHKIYVHAFMVYALSDNRRYIEERLKQNVDTLTHVDFSVENPLQ
jgi:hypothetical protein